MNDITEQIVKLLNKINLNSLLLLEKERRGIRSDDLVFVGMANIANYYWCAMQAVLKSRENELDFFTVYLNDRLSYAQRLGLIDKLPSKKKPQALLEIGSEITLEDIEQLLHEKGKRPTMRISWATMYELDEDGNEVLVIHPDLPLEMQDEYKRDAEKQGIRVADPEEFPTLRGRFLQTTRGQSYSSIRWNFQWDKYVVVGVPDGITDEFVYEFKTTRNNYLLNFQKPVAFTQADLYGYFFNRKEKRVQIHIMEGAKTETWQQEADYNRAQEVLQNFLRVDTGWLPPAPKSWKCESCEFISECPITPLH